ncbi:MAG: SpoIIE family protein phosphatase, partial [Bacteroidales bacterium]|nr:SpoIIE family protein phosphatase [Bacteroidales bacterium]
NAIMMSMLDEDLDLYTLASAYNKISYIYIRESEYDTALMYLTKVDSLCNKNPMGDIRLELYQNYHDLYMKVGDDDKANHYFEQYSMLSDSMYNTELTKMLRETELKHRDEEISHQKTLNAILFSIIAIVLTFIAVIAFLLVKKNRLNRTLNKLNADLKQRDAEISSNLDYAREIQLGCMSNSLTESDLQMFVLDRPKVVVGGDFYISQTKGDASYVVVGDCTGHGISGGFLSVLGIKSVYAAIEKYDTLPEIASFINNEFCEIVSSAENLKGESLCLSMVRICGNEVRFLGSKQKMWIVSVVGSDCSTVSQLACKPEVREYKSSNAIMGSAVNEEFAEEIININSGDVVFLSSDGYPDQFGAEGKLKYSRFRALLQECSQMEPDKAKSFLYEKLDSWRGDLEQTDDVMVVGMYF